MGLASETLHQYQSSQIPIRDKFKLTALISDNPVIFVGPKGEVLSRFNDDIWYGPGDLNNWRWQSADPTLIELYQQSKRLMFIILFHPELLDLELSTLRCYYYALRKIAEACHKLGNRDIYCFFSDPEEADRLLKVIQQKPGSNTFLKAAPGLFNACFRLGESLGFSTVRGPAYHEIKRISTESRLNSYQHPVIPWSIYKFLIHSVIERTAFYSHWLDDPAWTGALRHQATVERYASNNMAHKNVGQWLREQNPAFAKTISSYRALIGELIAMQQLSRVGILLFTGCRLGEEHMLLANCCTKVDGGEFFIKGRVDDDEFLIKGFASKTSEGPALWITNEFGAASVELALKVRKVVANGSGIDLEHFSHYLAPNLHTFPKRLDQPRPKQLPKVRGGIEGPTPLNRNLKRAGIEVPSTTTQDYDFLSELAVSSNIDLAKFRIDEPFPLTPHQFRRSFAYFIIRTKQVSFGGMKKQLKHAFVSQSEYYTSDAENVDHRDPSLRELVMDERLDEIDARLQRHLFGFETLSGGAGAAMKKDIEVVPSSDRGVVIEQTRSTMLKRAAQGEISYHETPLGACLSAEPCLTRNRAEMSACLRCKSAVLEREKIAIAHKLFQGHDHPFISAQADHFAKYLTSPIPRVSMDETSDPMEP